MPTPVWYTSSLSREHGIHFIILQIVSQARLNLSVSTPILRSRESNLDSSQATIRNHWNFLKPKHLDRIIEHFPRIDRGISRRNRMNDPVVYPSVLFHVTTIWSFSQWITILPSSAVIAVLFSTPTHTCSRTFISRRSPSLSSDSPIQTPIHVHTYVTRTIGWLPVEQAKVTLTFSRTTLNVPRLCRWNYSDVDATIANKKELTTSRVRSNGIFGKGRRNYTESAVLDLIATLAGFIIEIFRPSVSAVPKTLSSSIWNERSFRKVYEACSKSIRPSFNLSSINYPE